MTKQSIERLKAEHDVIERGLDLLEELIRRLDEGRQAPDGFPGWAVSFFAGFADELHHAKEEDVLFPLLKERGIPQEGGPIGVMLHEHEMGRDAVRRMREASQAEPFNAPVFRKAAADFAPLLRQHIFKENHVLFQMADRCMSGEDDEQVLRRFNDVEHERGLADRFDRCAGELAAWTARFHDAGT